MKNGEYLARLMQWCWDAKIDVRLFAQTAVGFELRFYYTKTGRTKAIQAHDWNYLEHFIRQNLTHLFAELVAPVVPEELKGNADSWGGSTGPTGADDLANYVWRGLTPSDFFSSHVPLVPKKK